MKHPGTPDRQILWKVNFGGSIRGGYYMRSRKTLVFWIVLVSLGVGCARVKQATLERGIDLFLNNKIHQALPVLEASARMCRDNPDAQAWLAECRRRLKRFDKAAEAAYAALALDEHHAFAHAVLGDLFAPHLSKWNRVDADSAWFHLREAVRSDPSEGGAWSMLWIQAMKRGEREIESRAAIQMIDSGFLSKPVLAYNRWQLAHLPEDAILLTNGDMDTYPSVALQEKENLRPDVAVVNLSLLDLAWYAEMLRDRHGIPLPIEPSRLRPAYHETDDRTDLLTPSDQIVQGWLRMQMQGTLRRPLCAAVTVADLDFVPDARTRMVLCGSYFEILPRAVAERADLERLGSSLESLDPAAFEGSFTTPVDRSPVRRAATDRIATNVTGAMLTYVDLLTRNDRWTEANLALAQAEDFDSRILAGGAHDAYMDSIKLRVEYHSDD
jgi:tetratricopeptide (TPR) repeat protein